MDIQFVSCRMEGAPPSVVKSGDVLTIDGDMLDFSEIPEGATLPWAAIDNPWISGPVRRIAGALQVVMLLPRHAPYTSTPGPLIDVPDGPVQLPLDPAPEPAQESGETHMEDNDDAA